MAQAGAQREPSMEEILASIRRIIENNEPGPDGNPGNGATFSQHDSDEDDCDADYVDQLSEVERPAASSAPAAHPVSLADVAARARSGSQMFSPEPPMVEADLTPPISDSEMMDTAAEELRQALTSEMPLETEDETAAPVYVQEQDEPVAQQPEAVRPAPDSGRGESPMDQQGSGQLVSLQTGEKVAAAFGELDAAIEAGQRRSFDEIAEEMLRPMLTQWLDDNLPTLVERLVREEIERVSRGNRR